ncbi:hypothetical protein CVT25_013437 [Psilocybe cyanescens]|uniref:Uncharacterized protein n=1 Tax=Psilocybe cyanescens TaxID=93625 RepID=A0A409WT46_PSICY|nr:hypothetical protein CVT25_013437 [Psilocybe cyanescens]
MSQQHLRHNEHIAHQHDVQLAWVCPPLSSEPIALPWDLNPKALQVDQHRNNDHHRDQRHHIREPLPPERLPEGPAFVVPREEQMEEDNERAFGVRTHSHV